MPRYICSTFPIAAYPRKGTITWTSSSRRRRKSLIAAYPRKGTITRRGLVCTDNHAIAAYPRKGTITSHQSARRTTCTDCNLSPQGDDNLLMLIFFIIISYCSLSPQGGKKLRIKRCGVFLLQTLTFCFLVGCSSMNGTIAAAVIFSLLRLLHSDKMCYNKANSKHLLQN